MTLPLNDPDWDDPDWGAYLFVGAFVGSKIALSLDQATLRKGFTVFLVFAAALVWFKK